MLNIMIVDDSKSVHSFIKFCLNKKNITFLEAWNGQEALEIIQQKKTIIDLILLDWEMPILDGPSTFEKLKTNNISCRVIMMTTKNEPENIIKMLNAGVDEYMLKPFTADILINKIEQVIEKELLNE